MEFQEEEREVVLSIYDGDPAFNQVSPVTFQYKYGEEGQAKSFLLELTWGEQYPDEKPTLNMDIFYNRHIKDEVKARIAKFVLDEAEQLIGSPMTYSLFECLKDKFEELIGDEDISGIGDVVNHNEPCSEGEDSEHEDVTSSRKKKKEQLTKAQKRKQWDRLDCKGERARGWDWVDIIHHLSQSGSKNCPISESS
ncbi:RWD domain-containing protein 4 [Cimex lectularius]|uniref:RWD domain-containing protein n=1 Tax=Cimex lectularius TaxID=79782 RepID=A0A8I6RPL9_CIMLE|nr:RWD domain-containing protein 4 [Cimex lectularius]